MMVGMKKALFLAAAFFSFPATFLTIVWNPVRRSINGPAVAAVFILIGGFIAAQVLPNEEASSRAIVESGILGDSDGQVRLAGLLAIAAGSAASQILRDPRSIARADTASFPPALPLSL